jgi:hypothetical protein
MGTMEKYFQITIGSRIFKKSQTIEKIRKNRITTPRKIISLQEKF